MLGYLLTNSALKRRRLSTAVSESSLDDQPLLHMVRVRSAPGTPVREDECEQTNA
jgi:hypothetical protein